MEANTAEYSAPPQPIHWGRDDGDGWRFAPHVNAYKSEIDYNSGRRTFAEDPEQPIESGDELLFVVPAEVEEELERMLAPTEHGRDGD